MERILVIHYYDKCALHVSIFAHSPTMWKQFSKRKIVHSTENLLQFDKMFHTLYMEKHES